YLQGRVNILSSKTGKFEPDILSQYETIALNINTNEVNMMIQEGRTEEAYKKRFVAACNSLNNSLPKLFERINDYTELLLPDYLLYSESVISNLVMNKNLIDSFKEVEVIGRLYQYYNTEAKEKVFEKLGKNKKVEKHEIPSATQFFTPKWIVQYMVDNTLGQLWSESHGSSRSAEIMEYYIKPAIQDEKVQKRLEE